MKNPVLENRSRLIVWGLVWLFLASGQALLFYFAYGSFVNISIPDIIVSLMLYSGLALSVWYPFSYFNKSELKVFSLITNLVLTGAITVTAWVLVTKLIMTLVLPAQNDYQAYWDATFPYRIGSGVFIYGLTVLTYFLFASMTNLAEKKAREAKLESLVRETELKMLRSQINPHFLFNSLNSISSLTVTDPEKARTMVIKLSDFMRYALSRKDEQPVSLRSELENLRLYLDIEKVRFGERLVTEENIDPACLEVMVPGMLIQPLYENAVKHGVYESTEKVKISTTSSLEEGYLKIIISNNFDPAGSKAKGTGTGLLNVSRRLELTYGNRASISTVKKEDLFTVTLFIPSDNPKMS
ncbi:MAG: histidine kinase [Bacteroidia bacterium]|nr:histidine kinase [Bacteroidia bacterium]